ncbi:gas vesicle protein [Longibacter sp.]|uniref:gas vesicle protein n=1 Tax=Longibacter sp. TaxID=2045415 RepID=UPI003EBD5050
MADRARSIRRNSNSDTLADILERVLETGIVIAGDIRVNLNDVELLTIQIRLIVCSVDKAEEMGMDWWKRASYLTSGASDADRSIDDSDARSTANVLASLDRRLERLEKRIEAGSGPADANDGAGNDLA